MSGEEFDMVLSEFSRFLSLHMGLRFPPERLSDLRRGVSSAAREFGFTDAEECVRWLMQAPLSKHQVEILASHLTIGETYFFRDPKMFETLETTVLPAIIRERRHNARSLRIWSAGCATGEEPYSLAIVLSRLIRQRQGWNITILGTDVNPTFLGRAKEGIYGEWAFRSVPQSVRGHYFTEVGPRRYRISSDIARYVDFSYLNLAEDAYPSLVNGTNAMDIILCRNVLMYFAPQQQRRVVDKFHRCLVPGGLLAVSPTEMSAVKVTGFSPEKLQGGVFFRKEAVRVKEAPAWMSDPAARASSPGVKRSERPLPAGDFPTTLPLADEKTILDDAETLFWGGRYEEAERKLEPIIAGSANCESIVLMAKVEANLGRLIKAREYCEKAIACERLNPGFYVLLATILQEMDLYEEQDTALKRALYLDQECVVAHFARANLALRRNAPREAERHFGNALAVLERMGQEEVVPLSEGVTAGRMREVIRMALTGRTV